MESLRELPTAPKGVRHVPPRLGKPSGRVFEALLSSLGAKTIDLLAAPARGFDNGVLRLGARRVLVFTADPISYIPSLGPRVSAWLSVHHLASDMATSGVPARFAVVDYNLPPDFDDPLLTSYAEHFGQECGRLGISIVGGHTGRYPGLGLTIIGSGFFFAEAAESGYITPALAQAGDLVLATKGPAIEATAVLAHSFPNKVRAALGPRLLARAKERIGECSVVDEAGIAAAVGLRDAGVTTMHDATEGGVVTALGELASSSGKEIAADLSLLPVPEDVARVCSLFGLDPFETLSEGTLVLTCRPDKATLLKARLSRKGIPAFEIGEVRSGVVEALRRGGSLKAPSSLPAERYWDVYAEGIEKGWT